MHCHEPQPLFLMTWRSPVMRLPCACMATLNSNAWGEHEGCPAHGWESGLTHSQALDAQSARAATSSEVFSAEHTRMADAIRLRPQLSSPQPNSVAHACFPQHTLHFFHQRHQNIKC